MVRMAAMTAASLPGTPGWATTSARGVMVGVMVIVPLDGDEMVWDGTAVMVGVIFSVRAFRKSLSARGRWMVMEISFSFQICASCFMEKVICGMNGVRCDWPFL